MSVPAPSLSPYRLTVFNFQRQSKLINLGIIHDKLTSQNALASSHSVKLSKFLISFSVSRIVVLLTFIRKPVVAGSLYGKMYKFLGESTGCMSFQNLLSVMETCLHSTKYSNRLTLCSTNSCFQCLQHSSAAKTCLRL